MSNPLQDFYKATISQDWSIGTGNFYVSVKPTTAPGRLVISPSSDTLREIVEYSTTGTDANGDYIVIITRGVGGTTEQTHTIGEKVRMNITAEDWEDMRDDIDSIVAAGAVNASTTERGIVQEATDAQVLAGDETGDTTAKLFITPKKLKDNVNNTTFFPIPIVRTYTPSTVSVYGDSTTRFDITNPSGTTFRYTWDGTGTSPNINTTNYPVGSLVRISYSSTGGAGYLSLGNYGTFLITASGTNYFEVTNASGVAENDVLLYRSEIGVWKNVVNTWTKPAGLKYIEVEMVGGGGGNKAEAGDSGYETGGGGGGYSKKIYSASELSSTEQVICGAGGQRGIRSGSTWETTSKSTMDGYLSSFKSMVANGGAYNSDTTGGTASGGDLNICGENGWSNDADYINGRGGRSILSPNTPIATDFSAINGSLYGAGSSGGYNSSGSREGAYGGNGIVIIKEFY